MIRRQVDCGTWEVRGSPWRIFDGGAESRFCRDAIASICWFCRLAASGARETVSRRPAKPIVKALLMALTILLLILFVGLNLYSKRGLFLILTRAFLYSDAAPVASEYLFVHE